MKVVMVMMKGGPMDGHRQRESWPTPYEICFQRPPKVPINYYPGMFDSTNLTTIKMSRTPRHLYQQSYYDPCIYEYKGDS